MKLVPIVDATEITAKTRENILRKSAFIDEVQYFNDGTPMFSWIDISLTELCNRVCSFCPRADKDFYPNQNLHLDLTLASKVASELREIGYKGGVVFCGYGEPMLHPRIFEVVRCFDGVRVELVTNGDRLSNTIISELFEAGLNFLCVSLYDGPHQVEVFNDMFLAAGISPDKFILRDRWHSEADSFGLKLTNRAGTLSQGPRIDPYIDKPCYYSAYSLTLDWNGDVLMCVQDWSKKVKFGNINAASLESVWRSKRVATNRAKLILGDRSSAPCNVCNTDGTIHGFNHVNAWQLCG